LPRGLGTASEREDTNFRPFQRFHQGRREIFFLKRSSHETTVIASGDHLILVLVLHILVTPCARKSTQRSKTPDDTRTESQVSARPEPAREGLDTQAAYRHHRQSGPYPTLSKWAEIHTFGAADGADEAGYQESAWDGGCSPTYCANDSRHVPDVSRFRRVVHTHNGDVGKTLVVITSYLSVGRQLGIHRVENPHLPTRQYLRGQCHLTPHETRATVDCRQSGPRQPPLAHQLRFSADSDYTA